jgi:hypothetical protein
VSGLFSDIGAFVPYAADLSLDRMRLTRRDSNPVLGGGEDLVSVGCFWALGFGGMVERIVFFPGAG